MRSAAWRRISMSCARSIKQLVGALRDSNAQ